MQRTFIFPIVSETRIFSTHFYHHLLAKLKQRTKITSLISVWSSFEISKTGNEEEHRQETQTAVGISENGQIVRQWKIKTFSTTVSRPQDKMGRLFSLLLPCVSNLVFSFIAFFALPFVQDCFLADQIRCFRNSSSFKLKRLFQISECDNRCLSRLVAVSTVLLFVMLRSSHSHEFRQ